MCQIGSEIPEIVFRRETPRYLKRAEILGSIYAKSFQNCEGPDRKSVAFCPPTPKSQVRIPKKVDFWGQRKADLWDSTSLEDLRQKKCPPMRLGRGKLEIVPSSGSQLRRNRPKSSGGPLDSYGGTPKAGSNRRKTTAICSSVADLLPGHILRVRGAFVETWQGGGNSKF